MCYCGTMNNQEKELTKWVKTRIAPKDYKILRKLAIDKEISLAELLREALGILVEEKYKGIK